MSQDVAPAARELPPLAHRDFRILCLSSVLAGMGFRGQFVVLGWLLLEASDSPFIVGLGIGMMIAPNALFGVLGGAVADRAERRHLLALVALANALLIFVLGLLVLREPLVWLILIFTFAGGSFWSVQQTARQSYAYDLVGATRVVSGLALLNLAQRVGGVAGSIGAGFVISAWGPGEAYIALAVAFFASGLVLTAARSSGQAAPVARGAVISNLREYVAELRTNRLLATLVLLTAAVEVLGFSHLSALPTLVRDELGGSGATLGVVGAFSSAGGIVAILIFSIGGDRIGRGTAFLGVLGLFGLSLVLLGLSGTLVIAIAAVTLVSGLAALSDVLSQSLVQLSVPNEMRGRAMGSWALAIGIAPLGHLQMGGLIALFGVSTALSANGIGLLLLALAAGAGIKRLRQL